MCTPYFTKIKLKVNNYNNFVLGYNKRRHTIQCILNLVKLHI